MSSLTLSDDILDVGDDIIITATFTDPDNDDAPIDPTAIALTIRDPAGAEEAKAISDMTHVSTGVFELAYSIDKNLGGTWYVRARATSGVKAAVEGPFVVRDSVMSTP